MEHTKSFVYGISFSIGVELLIDYINSIHREENFPIIMMTTGFSIIELNIDNNLDFHMGSTIGTLLSYASHTRPLIYILICVSLGASYLYLRKTGLDELKEYQYNNQIQIDKSAVAKLGLADDYNDQLQN